MTSQRLTDQELARLLAACPPEVEAELSNSRPDLPLLRWLAANKQILIEEQPYAPGEVVFNEGDVGDAMYLVRSGQAAVVRGGFDVPVVLGYRGAGEFVGEMALIENLPRSASVVALQELHLLKITREDFQQMLGSHSSIDLTILRKLSARLRAADDERETGTLARQVLNTQVTALEFEKKHLLELNQLRQEMTDLIIHDLRNPVAAIAGALSMLAMTLPREVLEANQELLDVATASCERAERLVNSLLDVERIQSGKVNLALEMTSLPHLIHGVVSRVTASLQSHDIGIQVSIPARLPSILIDADMIDRVLANLLDNAIKFTPRGGQIRLAAELRDDHVRVSVTDTGRGIPAGDRERIFERFAQGLGNEPRMRGFGLGLTFCRLAVQAHGGHIWVESGDDDRGSRFVFTLSLSRPTTRQDVSPALQA